MSLSLFELLKEDLKKQKTNKINSLSILWHLRRAGYSAVFFYRLSAACVHKGALGKFLALVLARLNLMLNGCDIYPNAVIGPGFLIGHPTGIVIGRSTIGSNFRIQQNATLGVRDVDDDQTNFLADGEFNPASYPTLADNVTVCAGAVVLGSITIGKGATIGANAVVLQNVPDGCLAVGVPARVLEKREGLPA